MRARAFHVLRAQYFFKFFFKFVKFAFDETTFSHLTKHTDYIKERRLFVSAVILLMLFVGSSFIAYQESRGSSTQLVYLKSQDWVTCAQILKISQAVSFVFTLHYGAGGTALVVTSHAVDFRACLLKMIRHKAKLTFIFLNR